MNVDKQSGAIRRLIYLLLALLVLLGIAAASGVFSDNVSTLDAPVVNVAIDDIESVDVTADGQTMQFVRSGERWRMIAPIEFGADQGRVNGLVRSLASLNFGSLVTENPDRYDVYGIGDSTGAQVELGWKGESATFWIGGKLASQRGDYIRVGNDRRVFKLDTRVSLPQPLESWRDKQVTAADTRSVNSIRIDRDGESYALNRGEGWTFSDGTAADSMKVANLVNYYANFRADTFLDAVSADSIRSNASRRVQLISPAGEIDVFFVPISGDNVAVAKGDSDAVYRIRQSRLTLMVPEKSSLE